MIKEFCYTAVGLFLFITIAIIGFCVGLGYILQFTLDDIEDISEFNPKKFPKQREFLDHILFGIVCWILTAISIVAYVKNSYEVKAEYTYPEYNLESIYNKLESEDIINKYKLKYVDDKSKEKIIVLRSKINEEVLLTYYKVDDTTNKLNDIINETKGE